MKNIYTILLAFLPIIGLNAQTIKVTFENEEIANGDTVKVETTAGEEVKSYFFLYNTMYFISFFTLTVFR